MAPLSTALISDSTCDIPDDLLAESGIILIPQMIIWGEEELRDRVDIQSQDFYRRLVADKRYPTTAHPTPQDFLAAYHAAENDGAQAALVITISGAMSGTFEAAKQAAASAGIPVEVIDARGPSMSLGWQVLAAARARQAGAGLGDMIQATEQVRRSLVQWVALDTLEYLYRGGRIGNATRLVGALLDLKPLVRINHSSGLVEEAGRARTRRKALQTLYEGFFKELNPGEDCLRLAVLHGNAPEDAAEMAERIRREWRPVELFITQTSPNLGVHTGPGAIALCGYKE